MNYDFPRILHINDVLPFIEERKEFVVAKRDFGSVINYNISLPDTFNMDSDPIAGAIRRECRGIKFFSDGTIAARVFHKWFNICEKEETFPQNINFSKNHIILDKLDGSMIHPMKVNGYIRWMTKMGITNISMMAEEFIAQRPKYIEFAEYCIENNYTPLFEYIGPNNRIVIPYKEENLILLAVRHNITGKYKNII